MAFNGAISRAPWRRRRVFLAESHERIDAGQSYWVARGEFHFIEADRLAVTLCNRSKPDKRRGVSIISDEAPYVLARASQPAHAVSMGEAVGAIGRLLRGDLDALKCEETADAMLLDYERWVDVQEVAP